jgi:ABC-type glycerol-3-phosphate transport system substrate-binding protein
VKASKLGKKVFGVPLDISEHIMYYRTDLIPSPPSTWEELLDTVKKLKAEGKGMIIDWGSMEWIGFAPFLWQAGGDFYNEDYTKAVIDSPEAETALNYFASLYAAGVPKTGVPLEQGMRTGDYPLAISGNWKIISLSIGAPEIKGKWAIAMLPAGPTGKRTAFIGGRIMGVFSASKNKQAAWEFIKFLSQADVQVKLYKASLETEDSYLPPNMDTWKEIVMDDNFKEVLESQALDAVGPPAVLGWDGATRFVNEAIQRAILKNTPPKEVLAKAAAEMTDELEKNKK